MELCSGGGGEDAHKVGHSRRPEVLRGILEPFDRVLKLVIEVQVGEGGQRRLRGPGNQQPAGVDEAKPARVAVGPVVVVAVAEQIENERLGLGPALEEGHDQGHFGRAPGPLQLGQEGGGGEGEVGGHGNWEL